MKCGKCGAEFASGKFCPECGCRVDVCPACGADRSAGSKFCNECGYSYLSPKQDVASAQGSVSKSMASGVAPSGEVGQSIEEKIAAAEPSGGAVDGSSQLPAEQAALTVGLADTASCSVSKVEEKNASAAATSDAPKAERKPFSLKGFIDRVKSKIGVERINAVYRWLPASLALFYGFIILLFLLAPAVNVDLLGEKMAAATGFGVMSGEFGASASVGAVFLLLISLGFVAAGGIRMYLAIKYPYYKPFVLGVVQIVMYCLAFVMSCVLIGGTNTAFTAAGAAGVCVLVFTLLGFFFIAAGTYLFKAGHLPELCSLQYSAAEDFKRDYAAAKARRREAKSSALAAATVAPALGVNAAFADGNAPAVNYTCADDYEAKVYTKQGIPGNVRSYRYAPSIISILYASLMLILMSLPLYGRTEIIGANISGMEAIRLLIKDGEFTGIFWIVQLVLLVHFWIFSLARLSKAISKPYSKMPIITVFQAFILIGILSVSQVSMLFGAGASDFGFVLIIISETVTAMYLFFGVLTGMCANTDENRFYIKRARAAAFEGKKMKSWAKALLIVIMLIVYALAIGLQFAPFGDKGFDTATAERINPGMSKSEVEAMLGQPYEEFSNTAYYYSKSYIKVFGKKDDGKDDDIDIDEDFDFDDLEDEFDKAEKEEAKKEEQIKKLTYKYYKIEYNSSSDEVASVMFDNAAFGDKSRAQKKVASVIKYKDKEYQGFVVYNATDISHIDVSIRYSDGSIEKRRVNNVLDYLSDINMADSDMVNVKFTYYPMFDGVDKVVSNIRIATSALTEILGSIMDGNAVNIPLNSSWTNMRIKVNESPDRFASLDDIACYKFTPKSSGTIDWYFGIDGVAAKVVDRQMNKRYVDGEYAYVDGGRQEYVYSLDVRAGEVYYFIPYNVDADSDVTSAMLHIEISN
ncbi:MAG: zinc ribbon domain-containing protein [Clostridia bacterium]|nr:zinc ribbon domain-containing protein [Clostridia bacterium]